MRVVLFLSNERREDLARRFRIGRMIRIGL